MLNRNTPNTDLVNVTAKKPAPMNRPDRLPQISYSLMKDAALKKKLIDLGIPGWGARALLIRRHSEWVNLVNANYDAARPRTKR